MATRSLWRAESAAAAPAAPRAIPVEVATAARKMLPVRVESLGTVAPIASVAIKARLETVITQVHFADGAEVKQGDLLFTLDSRQIEAEIRKVEAVIAGAQAQLQQAERDVARYTDLLAKNATTVVAANNAQTQVTLLRATAESNKAQLDNLKVQLEYTSIRAPISGRMSVVAGERRQLRASERHRAPRHDRAHGFGLRGLHGAAAQSCRPPAARWRPRPRPSR